MEQERRSTEHKCRDSRGRYVTCPPKKLETPRRKRYVSVLTTVLLLAFAATVTMFSLTAHRNNDNLARLEAEYRQQFTTQQAEIEKPKQEQTKPAETKTPETEQHEKEPETTEKSQ